VNDMMEILKEIKKKQEDLEIITSCENNLNITYCTFQSMFNLKHFNDFYLPKITNDNYNHLEKTIPGIFVKLNDYSKEHLCYLLNKGSLIIIINECVYFVNLSNIPKRNVSSSELDPINLLDSHDGFNEFIHDNVALIRKRLKTPNLVVEKYILGEVSQTDVVIIYLKDFEKEKYIKVIKEKLLSYKEKTLTNINDLNKIFSKSHLIPSVFNTSSPDYITSALLEGRVCIIADNTPVSIILPTSFTMFTTIKNESNEPKYYTFFSRLFTILFFNLSIFLMGLVIALTNFHPTLFSTLFMANIQITERGTTFPLFIESIIVLFLFEFFRLISSRSPNNYVQNIIIIFSGLFIGQNAISSGIVGESVLLLSAISYVSAFAITNNPHLITSIDIFRLYNLILSYTLGILGFTIGFFTTLLYLSNQTSVGEAMFSPFIPFKASGVKNFIFPSRGVKK